MTQVVFLLVPGVHLLDLATATYHGYGHHLRYVAEREEVPSAQGLTLQASSRWPALSRRISWCAPGPTLSAGPACSTGGRCTTHHDLQDELARGDQLC